ncbi:uncharacterized protein FPRO_10203 [Fusarium proliferatum ET1]|uniref:Related to tol protein n=1 Tax=Fusarium proliferatum (strain ET1) TaxID=1227346 RepID=A0A1L7VJ60_FUSPR|nr:uncharacterized protein FPRO_10203 [Fusarium proliferatum ET1]CZR40613.1 related to tol protein [Fusarium proliferatum ET1]
MFSNTLRRRFPLGLGFCSECRRLVIVADNGVTQEHHLNLAELKSCAESVQPAPCPLCRLMWASVQSDIGPAYRNQLLETWPPGHVLLITGILKMKQKDSISISVGEPKGIHTYDHHVTGSIGVLSISANEGTVQSSYMYKSPRLTRYLYLGSHESREIQGTFAELDCLTSQAGDAHSERRNLTITRWLDHCRQAHESCEGKVPRILPPRLVDISDSSNIRLVEMNRGEKGRYVALSYCWGVKTNGQSVHQVKLKQATLNDLKAGMDQSRMTRTHLEGMQVARELGYRYIWIDALCIMQDNKRDWEHSALLVPEIYGNAELTILAGRSDNSRKGFVNLAKWYKPIALPVEVPYAMHPDMVYESSQRRTCRLHLPRNQNLGPAYRRAWCFQEFMLSRRVIAFGMEQLMFKCRENISFEDFFQESLELSQTIPFEMELTRDLVVFECPEKRCASRGWSFPTDRRDKGKQTVCSEQRHSMESALSEWHTIMRIYSTRNIFDPFDCFAALAGVARRYEKALVWATRAKPRYLAGMWETKEFFRELLWKSSEGPLRRPRKGQLPQPSEVIERAPSWSWMALEGSIEVSRPNAYEKPQPCCFPADDTGAWAPRDWGIDLALEEAIRATLPFSIEVRGRPHRVVLSAVPMRSVENIFEAALGYGYEPPSGRAYSIVRRPLYERLIHQGVVLRDGDPPINWPFDIPIAIGLLDIEGEDTTELWALPIALHSVLKVPHEGLLLSKKANGAFRRVGVFWVRQAEIFYHTEEQVISIE